MTVIDAVLVSLWIGGAILLGWIASALDGGPGAVLACAGIGLAAPLLAYRGLAYYRRQLTGGRPDLPICKSGRCYPEHYHALPEHDGRRFRCRCGDVYEVRSGDGVQEVWVGADGDAPARYMVRAGGGPWTPARDERGSPP